MPPGAGSRAMSPVDNLRMDSVVIQRWALATLCILFTGCTVCENARRTVWTEPSAFYWKKDKRRSMAVYSSWADAAWSEESQSCPDMMNRPDYRMGFHDGFVDFVWGGGTGEPPPVPPRKMWNVVFRSDEGHQLAEDWFAGYRHGARVARDGGYRSLATLRSSMFGMEEGEASNYPADMWPGGGMDSHGDWSTTQPLPAPDMAPAPPASGSAIKDTTEEPSEIAPPSDAPADAVKRQPPDRKPVVPPPPHDLPPISPRNLTLPDAEEPPLDLNDLDSEPAEAPATERETPDEIEPVPLSIPPAATDSKEPADETKTPEPTTTSVRFVGVPTIAGGPPRLLARGFAVGVTNSSGAG